MWIEKVGCPLAAMRRTSTKFMIYSATAHKLLEQRSSDLRFVIGFYTGHNFFRYRLKTWVSQISDSASRRPILYECHASCKMRHQVLGEHFNAKYYIVGRIKDGGRIRNNLKTRGTPEHNRSFRSR